MPTAVDQVIDNPHGGAMPRFGAIKEKKGVPDLRTTAPGLDIIDIRRVAVEINLKTEVLSQFRARNGPRTLPTLLLYDEKGLQLFEKITYLDEYYLTNDEIEVLGSYAAEIVKDIPSGAMVIELGSGNLRKVNLLLQALEDAAKDVDYYALDLSLEELQRTLAQLPAYKHVRAHGLWGTYDDGQAWLKSPGIASRKKCIMSLGSSVGNFGRADAADFLKGFSDVLGPGDAMLIGLDGCANPARVYHAYNDKEGVTHEFILNGLRHANKVLGENAFDEKDWRVVGEYVCDAQGGRHQAFYSPVRDTIVMGERVQPHERIKVEQSLKYSSEEAGELWRQAGMTSVREWRHREHYALHMLTKPKMSFSLIPSVYARTALPSLEDWEGLWATWDTVTREMLTPAEFHEKPIKLRNACIFYLGHIPTFLDIQLTKTTKAPATDPATYSVIFERGIDPDVDNPEKCHDHSPIPDEWPAVEEIVAYQDRVRARVQGLYKDGMDAIPRHVGRAIWVGFEHEAMHLETLLYMMLQSDKTLPPPGVAVPDFERLAAKARAERVPNEWFDIPEQEVVIGMDDPEDGTDTDVAYGWDNEKPARRAQVHAFQAQGRAISNEEYARYLYNTKSTGIPASWARTNDAPAVEADGTNGNTTNDNTAVPESFIHGKAVRTVYGLVPLEHALDWPVFASYDELAGCAAWMGGRIPTMEEARSVYAHAEVLKNKQLENQLSQTVPAVNGHLCNNGVEISPPATPTDRASSDGEADVEAAAKSTEKRRPRQSLFTNLDGNNSGFRHWHPVPVTSRGESLAGQADMGGVWEWTSSVLARWDGFEAMPLYPGYTADFFDEKHNVVLGGSWATHPRLAGRKSFVNWYQRNYPYAWVGARLVRDLQ
ncbi:C-type lectin protein [Dichotomopilus funicola]|uniref:C-type lectin protein n=1 Tax=Dichotomopilus funicola TaxID=1934379 RepID=A0AAN6UWQ7_9PEZI|nr:C-type lectin protein [Dichotomopilus funicola]